MARLRLWLTRAWYETCVTLECFLALLVVSGTLLTVHAGAQGWWSGVLYRAILTLIFAIAFNVIHWAREPN